MENGTTVVLEADEAEFGHWSVEEVVDGKIQLVWYWYIWIGVLQRANPDKFWIKALELKTSKETAKMPKLKHEDWAKVCNYLFNKDTKAVLMTDSASAYAAVGHVGIVDKHTVNHSEKEYARSIEFLANTLTRQKLPGMAGTMAIDQEWRRLRECVPDNLSPKTADGRKRIELHVRTAQWRRWHRNQDPWPHFCKAVSAWRDFKRSGAAAEEAEQISEAPAALCDYESEFDHDIDFVPSAAGGLAERCGHIDQDIQARCADEVYTVCPSCFVGLCSRHASGGQWRSMCHSHNKLIACECLQCVWGWADDNL